MWLRHAKLCALTYPACRGIIARAWGDALSLRAFRSPIWPISRHSRPILN